jgi:hypothetical protein
MERDDDPGDVLEDVARIHPAVDRLRQLLTTATILDLRANSEGYWAAREGEESSTTAPERRGA